MRNPQSPWKSQYDGYRWKLRRGVDSRLEQLIKLLLVSMTVDGGIGEESTIFIVSECKHDLMARLCVLRNRKSFLGINQKR